MTDKQIDAIYNAALNATPGPYQKGEILGSVNAGKKHIAMCNYFNTRDEEQRITKEGTCANQEYLILANPSAIIELIDEYRKLKSEKEDLEDLVIEMEEYSELED